MEVYCCVTTYTLADPPAVDLASLSTQQLSQVKKQLDDELEHLTNSFTQLRAAQAKFRECLKSIAGGVTPKADSKLIPCSVCTTADMVS